MKRPRVEKTDPTASAVPSSSAPSSSIVRGVTLEAIMVQLQRMQADFGGHLDYLTNEMCQMKTLEARIARRQARMTGLARSPSPSIEASLDDDDEDDENDASSFDDDEMTTYE